MLSKSVVVAVVICGLILGTQGVSQEFEVSLRNGIDEFARTGRKNSDFINVVEKIKLPNIIGNGRQVNLDPAVVCLTCDIVVDAFIAERRNGSDVETLTQYIANICITMDMYNEEVCYGVVRANMDVIVNMIDNKLDLSSLHACSIVLQDYGCESDTIVEWAVDIPEKLTEVPDPDLSLTEPLKILHFSDLHYDPLYQAAGGLAVCDRPVCCQIDSGNVTVEEEGAGVWGDFRNCDTPWNVIQDALDHMKTQFPVDMVYFTGDIISHRVWETSVEINSRDIRKALQAFKETFSVPVYPILGNHEPHPLNVWVGINDPLISSQWVFDVAVEEWASWLPSEALETISKGGYYTLSPKPGLRIIGLNSNVCYTYNFWLLYDEVDPFGQLQWLVDVLTQAELAGERVHILSHIPSGGGSCLKNWSVQMRRIVDRFSGTIAAIFNGHTHNSQFNVFFKADNLSEAAAVAYNGGSITSYSNLNPNYRVYSADAESFEILDFEEWTYHINEANLTPELPPTWYKFYNFKEAFGMDRMRPSDLSTLLERMATSQNLLDFYAMAYVKNAAPSLELPCDSACHLGRLCEVVENAYGDSSKCEELQTIFNPS